MGLWSDIRYLSQRRGPLNSLLNAIVIRVHIGCDVLFEVILSPLASLLTEIRQTILMLGRHVMHCIPQYGFKSKTQIKHKSIVIQVFTSSASYSCRWLLLSFYLKGFQHLPLFTISSTLSNMTNYIIRILASFISPAPLFTSRVPPPPLYLTQKSQVLFSV